MEGLSWKVEGGKVEGGWWKVVAGWWMVEGGRCHEAQYQDQVPVQDEVR